MFIELHILQNFVPSNLNRDDTNNPKDCIFGGTRRARISSQCMKRAIRETDIFTQTTLVDKGMRTKTIMNELYKALPEEMQGHEAEAILADLIAGLLSKLDSPKKKDKEDVIEIEIDGTEKKQPKTAVLLYISQQEIDRITEQLTSQWEALADEKGRKDVLKKMVNSLAKEFKSRTSASDIALFGRMLAEKPVLNLEASCQVAHALSTHRVTMEMDFYTAMDDLQGEDTPGAGMMGFTGYNSACFYRYARLDWGQLYKNLGDKTDLAQRTVEGFLRASIEAVPSGKANSFAHHNPPSLIMAVVRKQGMGWSLANAFEQPVNAMREGGYVAPSAQKLDQYWQRLCKTYGNNSLAEVAVVCLDDGLPLDTLASRKVENLEQLIDNVVATLPTESAG